MGSRVLPYVCHRGDQLVPHGEHTWDLGIIPVVSGQWEVVGSCYFIEKGDPQQRQAHFIFRDRGSKPTP